MKMLSRNMRRHAARRRLLNPLLQAILVIWAAGLVLYFQAREGLIRWGWMFQPADGGWFHEKGLPDPRMQMPHAAEAPVAPYVQILKNALVGPYNIEWSNAPWGALGIAAVMLGAYTVLGWLFVSAFRMFVPLGARLCLALTLGTIAVGISAELLAMADRLTRPWVMGMWVLLFVAGGGLWIRALLRRNSMRDISSHTRLTPREEADLARHWFKTTHRFPQDAPRRLVYGVYVFLFSLITLVVTLHAVGQPVTYWDSLILYVGYARDIYLQGGFPVKVVGQVGVGLGANYPHLFEVLAAQTAVVGGYWSDSFAQLLPPVATLAAMLLVYYTVTELTRERLLGMAAALVVRSVPYGLSYSQFASNYSLAILFTAAFLYLAVKLVRDGLPAYRNLMLLVIAGAVHINYLMLGLCPIALIAIYLATRPVESHPPLKASAAELEPLGHFFDDDAGLPPLQNSCPPEPLALHDRPALRTLLKNRSFWVWILFAALLASPWYVRNIVVTGNPVYAFYSDIFPSKNVNPDVMKSAEVEWLLNGDGLGRAGRTIPEKLRNSWVYFVTGDQHWKLSPFIMAFVMPGFVVWCLWAMVAPRLRRRSYHKTPPVSFFRAFIAPAGLFLLLWFYAYAVADFYLYQIIIILPLFGVFTGCLFYFCTARPARLVLHVLVIVAALSPGLAMGVMGFKLKKVGVYEGMPPPQLEATALRRLFMRPSVYYRMEFGGDMEMLANINALPNGTVVLTHENRALLLNPGIKIVHLDDWEPQQAYGKPVTERVGVLDELGVEFYLYVPNEDRHVANSWLGMEELISEGYFEQIYATRSVDGGARGEDGDADRVIPQGQNVLFKRTAKTP